MKPPLPTTSSPQRVRNRSASKFQNQKKKKEYVELSPELQRLVDLNLPSAAARHTINLRAIPLKFCKNLHRRGKHAKNIPGTQQRYDTQYRQLWSFLALRGAWDSMLILLFPKRTKQSPNCPAMDVEELCHFVRYKISPSGMDLKDGNNEESTPLVDVFGNRMVCAGGWKAGKTMDMFGTSLSCIHKVHGHDRSYMPSCGACQENDDTIEHGCWLHRRTRKSLAFRQGNPSLSNEFINNKKALVDKNYQARVSTQIDPGDVRAIRKAMLGGLPTVAGLKFYVMVLISVKLFLRADEIINLATCDIPPELFYRVAGVMKSIGMCFSGKRDEGGLKWFLLWADDVFPDVCPLRHFLIYIYFAGIKKGYCFPTDRDLHSNDVGFDGLYLKHESYQTLLNGVKKMAKEKVFEYDTSEGSDFRATVHIFRKGAYYFRIIASPTDNIDWVSLRYDARHEREADMFIYVRDAATLRQAIDFNKHPEMKASDNRRARFETKCAAVKILSKGTDTAGLSLYDLARQYVLSLGVGANPSLAEALKAALKKTEESIESKAVAFQASLSDQQRGMYDEIMNCLVNQHNNNCEALAREAETAALQVAAQQQQPNKRKRKAPPPPSEGEQQQQPAAPVTKNDLKFDDISRENIKNCPTLSDKLKAHMKLEERMPEKDKDLTGPAKKWAITCLRPALCCLRNHHNNSLEQYQKAWNESKNTWKMKHTCSGKPNQPCVALT